MAASTRSVDHEYVCKTGREDVPLPPEVIGIAAISS
jgi:hypothetical protein